MAFARIKFAKNLPSLEATNPRDIYFKPIFCINLGGNNFLDLEFNSSGIIQMFIINFLIHIDVPFCRV